MSDTINIINETTSDTKSDITTNTTSDITTNTNTNTKHLTLKT